METFCFFIWFFIISSWSSFICSPSWWSRHTFPSRIESIDASLPGEVNIDSPLWLREGGVNLCFASWWGVESRFPVNGRPFISFPQGGASVQSPLGSGLNTLSSRVESNHLICSHPGSSNAIPCASLYGQVSTHIPSEGEHRFAFHWGQASIWFPLGLYLHSFLDVLNGSTLPENFLFTNTFLRGT